MSFLSTQERHFFSFLDFIKMWKKTFIFTENLPKYVVIFSSKKFFHPKLFFIRMRTFFIFSDREIKISFFGYIWKMSGIAIMAVVQMSCTLIIIKISLKEQWLIYFYHHVTQKDVDVCINRKTQKSENFSSDFLFRRKFFLLIPFSLWLFESAQKY